MNHLHLVEPAPDIQVHPTIVTAIGTMHTWLADHPDTAQWLAQLPIERQLQLTDLAIRSYLAGRAAQEYRPCEPSGTSCSASSSTDAGPAS